MQQSSRTKGWATISCLLILFLGPTAVAGQLADFCDELATREFVPSPALAGAEVSVRVFGWWPSGGPPQVKSATVTGSEIRVTVQAANGGPQRVIPFWEGFVSLGTLSSGAYEVYVDITYVPAAPSEDFSCGPTRQVVVLGGPVPGLGIVGRLVLIALIAGAAFFAFRSWSG